MSAVFISHASQDRAKAEEVKRALAAVGYGSVFLDFDERQGIAGGTDWEKTLHVRLRGCRVLIALNSHAFRKSAWCHSEVTVAKTLDKLVLPALIDDSDPHDVLRHIQAFNLRDDHARKEQSYAALIAALEKANLVKGSWDAKTQGPPYPGLEAFDERYADVFFGRDAATRDCLEKLEALASRPEGGKSWLVLYGASGSGKSSLMRAGVVPACRRSAGGLMIGPFRPGREPLESLARALREAFGRYAPTQPEPRQQDLVDLLRKPDHEGLGECLQQLRRAANRPSAVATIAIDQLEEALSWASGSPGSSSPGSSQRPSVAAESPRDELARLLRRATAPHARCLVLATLRADFMGAFHDFPALRGLEYEAVVVKPITDVADIRALIEKPAELANVAFDDGLVEEIVRDVVHNDALPLLAFALERLWTLGAEDGLLTRAEYHASGRIKEAVKTKADLVLAELALSEPDTDALRSALLQLVRFGDNNQPVRALGVRFCDLPARAHPALEAFVAAHLLVSGGESSQRLLSVAHEALFRAWPRLTGWIDDQRVLLSWRRKIQQRLEEWQVGGAGQADQLLRGAALNEALELRRRNDGLLSELEDRFISAAEDAAAGERARARRLRRVFNVGGAVSLVVIALVALRERNMALAAKEAADDAMLQKRKAVAAQQKTEQMRQLALDDSARNAYLKGHADKAMLYALRNRRDGSTTPTTRTMLSLAASLTIDAELAELTRHRDVVYASATVRARDRSFLATGSADGSATLWNVDDPRHPVELGAVAHGDKVRAVALSPDARWLATGGTDGNVRLWNLENVARPQLSATLQTPKQASSVIWSVAFGADNRHLLVGGSDNTAWLWDVTDRSHPRLQRTLSNADGTPGHDFLSVAMSPDGRWLAAASSDGEARIWDLSRLGASGPGDPRSLSLSGSRVVSGIAFSPDSEWVLTTTYSNTAQLWYARTGQLRTELKGHTNELTGGAFSADGRLIVTSSFDGTARIWSVPSGEPQLTLVGHEGVVASAAFLASDRNDVVTTGEDRTVRLWSSDGPLRTESRESEAFSASFSPDGTLAVVVLAPKQSKELTAMLLRLDGSDAAAVRLGPANSAEFSPDGTKVVTAGDDGSAAVYQVAAPDLPPAVLKFGSYALMAAELRHDGQVLATGGEDPTASLWDLAQATPERTPLNGHTGQVKSVAFDAQGQRLLTASSDESVILWDVHEPRAPHLQHRWEGITRGASSARFSPDGQWVAVAGQDGRLRLLKPQDPSAPALELEGDGNPLFDVHFSADGLRMITAGARGSIGLWDLASCTLIALLRGHQDEVLRANFSLDGRRAVSAGYDGLRFWDVHMEERSAEQLQALVDRGILWQWVGEALQPTHPHALIARPN